jgi:hypothetical protein
MAGKNGSETGHVVFIWKPSGYELAERPGAAPAPGSEVEEDDKRFLVVKTAPSPLPGDSRVCAYLQAV